MKIKMSIRWIKDFENSLLETKVGNFHFFRKWVTIGNPRTDDEYIKDIWDFLQSDKFDVIYDDIKCSIKVIDLEDF